MHQIQGTWKVTEVNYIYDNHTQTYHPTNQEFIFDNSDYEHWQDGEIKETGIFIVNNKATHIQFGAAQGAVYTYTIINRDDNNQHWRSKNKLIDFYLDFKLEKLY